MASKLQELIQKYKKKVDQLSDWAEHTDQQKAQRIRIEKLSQLFMKMILYINVENEDIQKVDEKWMSSKVNELLGLQSTRKKVKPQFLKQIIGAFIRQEFEENQDFIEIKQEISLHYEDSFGQFNSSIQRFQDEEQFDQTLFLAGLKQTTNDQTNGKNQSQFINQSKFEEQTYGNNPHQMQVMKYLTQLGAPQSQLLYLCQFMSWKSNTRQIQEGNKYKVQIEVNIQYKKLKTRIIEFHIAKSKKIGKMGASFKVLRKIYIKYPQIWHLFDKHKNEKQFKIDKDPYSHVKLMVLQLTTQSIKVQDTLQTEDNKKTKERQDYLAEITNYKTQMNYVLQQNPQVLSHPKMMKAEDGKMWKVKGQLIINSKNKQPEIYVQVISHLNSKVAEQEIAKALLHKLYQNHHDILQRMILFKQKKFSK